MVLENEACMNDRHEILRQGLKSTPQQHVIKMFSGGRYFVQGVSTFQPPLKYSHGGSPMGMGDHMGMGTMGMANQTQCNPIKNQML